MIIDSVLKMKDKGKLLKKAARCPKKMQITVEMSRLPIADLEWGLQWVKKA